MIINRLVLQCVYHIPEGSDYKEARISIVARPVCFQGVLICTVILFGVLRSCFKQDPMPLFDSVFMVESCLRELF